MLVSRLGPEEQRPATVLFGEKGPDVGGGANVLIRFRPLIPLETVDGKLIWMNK